MARCEIVDSCAFFKDQMKGPLPMAELYKERYCKRDNAECARYLVYRALGPEAVPDDLIPNQADPPVVEDSSTGYARCIFDRRNGLDRRTAESRCESTGERRGGDERRKLPEKRKGWIRTGRWCSTYGGGHCPN
ncbi:MAG: hypothetical protein JRF59_11965 [Deltaproteobacteria bacterium]|nr:hypothetical protein [Deltaproteobacteria bacterium]MBW1951202.1 hypothetical protein [Deltaproteobacteria bacterium]MBW2009784.1 hypothetical protein [Deltaproteobacteria bacterium]MBW2348540.1 hypothetical protein [Deltaproteobacteria bacterium]